MSWKKIIKNSKLIPFPPGNAPEEPWGFPYAIQETFVHSPRNRRRMSHFEGINIDQHYYHMVDTGLGVSHLEGIDDLDDLEAVRGRHPKQHL